MSICDGALAPVLRELGSAFGWSCQPVDASRALIDTGRRFADSEPVEVLVTIDGDVLSVSDGGVILGRLATAGFELDDDVNRALWRDALYQFRISHDTGLVLQTASIQTAALAIARLADAMLGLDGLRLVAFPKGVRVRTLADDVEEFLRSQVGDDAVTRNPIVDVGGMSIRPTFRVATKRAPLLVQTAATTTWKHAFEHAFATFSLVDRAEAAPLHQRLIVLGGSAALWGEARIQMLSDVAYVGLWAERGSLEHFLRGELPADRVLIQG